MNDAMSEYHEVFGHELEPLAPRPVLSDYYTPSDEQHDIELALITLSMIGIGGVLWYLKDLTFFPLGKKIFISHNKRTHLARTDERFFHLYAS